MRSIGTLLRFQVAEKFFHDEAKSAVGGVLPGAASFKLYDTYGLAFDEQEEMARETGLTIDRVGFEARKDEERARARASWRGAEKARVAEVYHQALEGVASQFVGRDALDVDDAHVERIVLDGSVWAMSVDAGADAEIVLDRTPFYAEAGGQAGDRGALYSPEGTKLADVVSVYRVLGAAVHKVHVRAKVAQQDLVIARVDPAIA